MGKIAFVFSGQGAQYPGMGKRLYDSSPKAKAVFDRAEQLRPGTLEQCFDGDAETLKITGNTQPCLFSVDMACAAAVCERGVVPQGVAGFSLGEVAAVAFGGMLDFDDAFRLVCKRGELMQRCAEERPGAMSAVLKLDAKKVEELAGGYSQVFPVNYNAPAQTVVAGAPDQLAEFEAAVKAENGVCIRLKVGGGFHSPFMQDAAAELLSYMNGISFLQPDIDVYANATAKPYMGDPKALLSRQIKSPVRWNDTINNMAADGYDCFIEVGAGKTLYGLIKKICNVRVAHVEDDETLQQTMQMLEDN